LDNTKEAGCFINSFNEQQLVQQTSFTLFIPSFFLSAQTITQAPSILIFSNQGQQQPSPSSSSRTRNQEPAPPSFLPSLDKQAARGRALPSLSSFSSSKQLSITILLVNKQQQLQLISLASKHVQSATTIPAYCTSTKLQKPGTISKRTIPGTSRSQRN
ncbi:unnamed protein product, partial [Linum tenue]